MSQPDYFTEPASVFNESYKCVYSKAPSAYGSSLKRLKHCLACALCEIRHLVCGLHVNTLSFASCFISISAMYFVIYFRYSTSSNALSITYVIMYT